MTDEPKRLVGRPVGSVKDGPTFSLRVPMRVRGDLVRMAASRRVGQGEFAAQAIEVMLGIEYDARASVVIQRMAQSKPLPLVENFDAIPDGPAPVIPPLDPPPPPS